MPDFPSDYVAPAAREETVTSLRVTGTIPEHLDGRYVRTGPNPLPGQFDPDNYSIFGLTGDGMVHGVRLRDGNAEWYRSRWVRAPHVSRLLGEKPVKHGGQPSFIAPNTGVFEHAGRTLVVAEGGAPPYELTDELETVGPCDFGGTLPGGFTGHPKVDPVTGELHAVTYGITGPSKARYVVVSASGRVRKAEEIDVPGRPLLHDIALTENYVVLFDTPLLLDPDLMMRRMAPRWLPGAALAFAARFEPPSAIARPLMYRLPRPKTGQLPLRWDARHPARIGLIPRNGPATVRWFDIDPCYVFHTLNAYEEDGAVVCDAVRIEWPTGKPEYDIREVLDEGQPRLNRWTVDLATGTVKESLHSDRTQEFPMVDPRRIGRKHTYGYTVAFEQNGDDDVAGSVLRYDLGSEKTSELPLPPGHLPGEFSAIPASPDAPEQDGLLMGFTYDRANGVSNLLILEASTLTKLAEVHLPTRVPFLFHGNWLPAN